jgi:multidrug efflux pump subunit AcrA (membrane-fusion protein)
LVSTLLVVIIVVICWLATRTLRGGASPEAPISTATVQLGTVQSRVAAIGQVSPVAVFSVNFQTGGTVSEIDVKVGDEVMAGQTLAKIDDTQLKAALVAAQASLTAAQASLAGVQQPAIPTAGAQGPAAVQLAEQQVASAQVNLAQAQQTAALNATRYQDSVGQAQDQLARDTDTYAADEARCAAGATTGFASGPGGGTWCTTLLDNERATLTKDRNAVSDAARQQTAALVVDQQFLDNARTSLTSAQNNLAATVADYAKTTAVIQAQVDQAQANLATAQRNEANAVLTAPRDGTITAVNGLVGQTVSAGSATAASTGTSASGASGNSSSSSSSSAFITLEDRSSLQVVAGFAEVDASKVQVGQPVAITLNDLPSQSIPGQVTNVDVVSTVVSNVAIRNVTTTLTNAPTGVKPGMTVSVSVVVGQHSNVLELPTADITTLSGQSTVTLLRGGKRITQVVSTGLVGDQMTEITSGVNVGEVVVAPLDSLSDTGTVGGTNRIPVAGGIEGGGSGGGFIAAGQERPV